MYERDMTEATKTGHDAAKKMVTVIKSERDSPTTGKGVASALAITRYLASGKAGGSGSGKRKDDGHDVVDELADKKVQVDGEAADSKGGAARNGSDSAVQTAKKTVAGMSASHRADVVDAAAASYKFPVDDFTRALKAVDVLVLKWSTRAQRAVLRGATMEQRAIAFLLAQHIYAAKLRKEAAAKFYSNVARQSHLALKAAEAFGQSMEWPTSTARPSRTGTRVHSSLIQLRPWPHQLPRPEGHRRQRWNLKQMRGRARPSRPRRARMGQSSELPPRHRWV